MSRAIGFFAVAIAVMSFLGGGRALAEEKSGEELKKEILKAVERLMDRKLEAFRDEMRSDLKALLERRGREEAPAKREAGESPRRVREERVIRLGEGAGKDAQVQVRQEGGKARIRIERDGKVIEKDIDFGEGEEEDGEGWADEELPPFLRELMRKVPEGMRKGMERWRESGPGVFEGPGRGRGRMGEGPGGFGRGFGRGRGEGEGADWENWLEALRERFPEGFREGMRWAKEFAPRGFEFEFPGRGRGRMEVEEENEEAPRARAAKREASREEPKGGREAKRAEGGKRAGAGPGNDLARLEREKDALRKEIEELRQAVRKLQERRERDRR